MEDFNSSNTRTPMTTPEIRPIPPFTDTPPMVALTHVNAGTAGLCAKQETCDCVQSCSSYIDDDLGFLNVYAGYLSSSLVAADGVHVFAVAGVIEYEPHNKTDHNCNDEHVRDLAEQLAGCDGGVCLTVAAQRSCIGVNQADAVYSQLHAQGADEGRYI